MRRKLLPALLPALVGTAALATPPVTGRWLTKGQDSIVEVAPCGAQLCGRIVKILNPAPDGATTDRNNPDPALRNRPLLGLAILTGFTDKGGNWSGTIYDPRNGKSYRSFLARNANGTLKVQGCIAFFCQTEIWAKAQ